MLLINLQNFIVGFILSIEHWRKNFALTNMTLVSSDHTQFYEGHAI